MKKLSDIFILYNLIKITLSTYKRKKQTIRKNMTFPNNPEQIVNVKIKKKQTNTKKKTTCKNNIQNNNFNNNPPPKKKKERKWKEKPKEVVGLDLFGLVVKICIITLGPKLKYSLFPLSEPREDPG